MVHEQQYCKPIMVETNPQKPGNTKSHHHCLSPPLMSSITHTHTLLFQATKHLHQTHAVLFQSAYQNMPLCHFYLAIICAEPSTAAAGFLEHLHYASSKHAQQNDTGPDAKCLGFNTHYNQNFPLVKGNLS